jgi:hypothetical protein
MKRLTTAAALVAVFLSPQQLAAQHPNQAPRDTVRRETMGMDMRQQMRVMDSMNARLDTLVGRMNRSTGNAKVGAMAQVISELVSQRRAMQTHMQQMMMRSHGKPRGDHMMMEMHSDSAPVQTRKPKPDGQAPGTDTSGHAEHHKGSNPQPGRSR